MSLPKPIFPLTGHCSVVFNGTLYVYSPAGFQALDLKEGASWEAMPMDISLTGAQCVKAEPKNGGDPMLYIVGGSVNETAATWDYPGLMHYSFAQKKWDWVRAESFVTQNRLNHAAAYLPESNSLLVYAGSQNPQNADLSSSTFLMSLDAPFYVRSSPSNNAPPGLKPMLMPLNDTSAIMIGGGAQNKAVFTFSQEAGWQNLGVTLTDPIANPDAVQCTIVNGDDGSAVLEKYDLSTTPNQVTRIALLNKGGVAAAPGTIVGPKSSKRETVNEWLAYNGTYAPKVTRSGYSIAQADNAETVITGGSEQDPLCIFDQRSNSWLNATSLFAGDQVTIQSLPSPSVSPTSDPTSTAPTPSSTSSTEAAIPAPVAATNKGRMLTVLGATLGTIFGIAAILILLLFCLKRRKNNIRKTQQSGSQEKDRLSFADRGADYMSEAGGPRMNQYPPAMNVSQSSLAIVSGHTPSNHKRGMGSDASTTGLVTKKSPLGYSEPMEMSKFDLKPEPIMEEKLVRQNSGRVLHTTNVNRSRSSGWSKYFANNEATNLAHMPSGRSTYASERTSTGSQSMYTESNVFTHPSQAIPPLEIPKFDGQRLSRVATGSPTLGNSSDNLPVQPMQAELGRANSNGSVRSGYSNDYYSRRPVESWTPVGDDGRPASSNYTNSLLMDNNIYNNDNRDGASAYFADDKSSFYPKSNYSSFYPGQPKLSLDVPDGRESTFTLFPSDQANQQSTGRQQGNLYPGPPRLPAFGVPDGRGSTATVFPGGPGGPDSQQPSMTKQTESFFPDRPPPKIPGYGHPQERESTVTVFPRDQDTQGTTDMSWLNLGAHK